jgi:outer membrane protein assembly factor BamE
MPLLTAFCRTAALAVAVLAAGCSSVAPSGSEALFGFLTPYRVDIQQGNVVTQEQVARIKPGMNRLQVRDALGSPLLTDPFHTDRWDYIFVLRQGGKIVLRRNVVLTFDGDVLKGIEAPDLPTEREFIDSIARTGRLLAASQLELSPEQLRNLPVPPRTPVGAPVGGIPNPIPATRTFPPLELN